MSAIQLYFTLCLFCYKFAPFEMSASLCSSFLGCLQLLGDSRNKVVVQFICCLCFHFYSLIRMTYTIVVCQANIKSILCTTNILVSFINLVNDHFICTSHHFLHNHHKIYFIYFSINLVLICSIYYLCKSPSVIDLENVYHH